MYNGGSVYSGGIIRIQSSKKKDGHIWTALLLGILILVEDYCSITV